MPFIIFSDEVSFPYLYQRCDFGSDFVKSTFITHIYSSYHCFFFCFQHEISVSRLWGVFLLPLHNSFPPTFLPKDLLSLDISPAGPFLTPSSSPRSPPPPPSSSPSPPTLMLCVPAGVGGSRAVATAGGLRRPSSRRGGQGCRRDGRGCPYNVVLSEGSGGVGGGWGASKAGGGPVPGAATPSPGRLGTRSLHTPLQMFDEKAADVKGQYIWRRETCLSLPQVRITPPFSCVFPSTLCLSYKHRTTYFPSFLSYSLTLPISFLWVPFVFNSCGDFPTNFSL